MKYIWLKLVLTVLVFAGLFAWIYYLVSSGNI